MKNKKYIYSILIIFVIAASYFCYKIYHNHTKYVGTVTSAYTNGIDVSHHNGDIDWAEVAKDSCIQYTIIKATEGNTWRDEKFKENCEGARRNGLLVGAYHFFRADKGGESQFENFRDAVGKDIDIIPVIDIEPNSGNMLSKSDYQQKIQNFIDRCEDYYGVKPILYINIHHYDRYVSPVGQDCLKWYGYDGKKFINAILRRDDSNILMIQLSENGKVRGVSHSVDIDYCKDIDRIRL